MRRIALSAALLSALLAGGALAQSPQAYVAPTAPAATNNNQIASTAWVRNFIAAGGVVLVSGTAHGDSAYNIAATDRYVYTNATFTAPRVWTLPAANSLAAGTTIWVQDAQNTVTSTNTLTVSRAGADTIDVGNTTLVITGAGGGITFTTDGVSNWGTPIQTPSTGGTGQKTLTNHGVLVGAGINPITQLGLGTTGQLMLGVTGADPAFATMSQDCTVTAAGVITCTKTNNVAFAASATTDTTNAANISSGTLAAARGGAGTTTGALKGDGVGNVSQAACASLSDATAWCNASATAWGTYTPTLACNSGSFTSASAAGRSRTIGKLTYLNVVVTITTNGTCASFASFTLPAAAQTTSFIGGRSSNGNMVGGNVSAGSSTLNYTGPTGTYVGGDGTTIAFNAVYENQ
jgi:hypothetical protein